MLPKREPARWPAGVNAVDGGDVWIWRLQRAAWDAWITIMYCPGLVWGASQRRSRCDYRRHGETCAGASHLTT